MGSVLSLKPVEGFLGLFESVHTGKVPRAFWSQVDQYVVRSDISLRWAGKSYGELTAVQQYLEQQITTLIKAAQKITDHFLFALLNPDDYLCLQPEFTSRGSVEETASLIKQTYTAWWEHEGVLELFCCALMLSGMATDRMHRLPANYGTVSRVSRHLLVRDEVIGSVCDFIAEAAEDAFSLSPLRPSDIRRQKRDRQ